MSAGSMSATKPSGSGETDLVRSSLQRTVENVISSFEHPQFGSGTWTSFS